MAPKNDAKYTLSKIRIQTIRRQMKRRQNIGTNNTTSKNTPPKTTPKNTAPKKANGRYVNIFRILTCLFRVFSWTMLGHIRGALGPFSGLFWFFSQMVLRAIMVDVGTCKRRCCDYFWYDLGTILGMILGISRHNLGTF